MPSSCSTQYTDPVDSNINCALLTSRWAKITACVLLWCKVSEIYHCRWCYHKFKKWIFSCCFCGTAVTSWGTPSSPPATPTSTQHLTLRPAATPCAFIQPWTTSGVSSCGPTPEPANRRATPYPAPGGQRSSAVSYRQDGQNVGSPLVFSA